MAKKKAAKSVKTQSNFVNSLPKNEIEHVELLIKHSEKARDEASSENLKKLFQNQADRNRKKLEELRER